MKEKGKGKRIEVRRGFKEKRHAQGREGRKGSRRKEITREISKRDVRVSVVGTYERTNERTSYSFHGNLI